MDLCLAVDIGGTKFAAALATPEGELQAGSSRWVPTRQTMEPGELWSDLLSLVELVSAQAARSDRIVVCGVGCGGPMAGRGASVSPLNIPAWRGFPLSVMLAEATRLPVAVDNDAKALTLAEGWTGAAQGRSSYLGMVVSTGVGGGIVLDGRLLGGDEGNAGHIGHVVVEPDGRACMCGGQGCLEAEASGSAIAAVTGRPPAEAPLLIVERTGRLVGRAVASVANLLDLSLAVVAGSVALGFGAPFLAAALEESGQRARLDFIRGTHIRPGALGAAGPLVGAAAVGWLHIGASTGCRPS